MCRNTHHPTLSLSLSPPSLFPLLLPHTSVSRTRLRLGLLSQVWGHVVKPVGVLTGMLSQFVLLPLSAFVLIQLFEINPLHAAGLLILASSPGGVTSNVFTFFLEGDLSLR